MAWLTKSKKQEEKKKKMTVQETIPYVEMGRDGICKVKDQTYSKLFSFMTSITSWRKMRIRTRFSRDGVTS